MGSCTVNLNTILVQYSNGKSGLDHQAIHDSMATDYWTKINLDLKRSNQLFAKTGLNGSVLQCHLKTFCPDQNGRA